MNHKSVWIRAIILALIVWIVYYIVGGLSGWFTVFCNPGINPPANWSCATMNDVFLRNSIIALPIILTISIGLNYLREFLIQPKVNV